MTCAHCCWSFYRARLLSPRFVQNWKREERPALLEQAAIGERAQRSGTRRGKARPGIYDRSTYRVWHESPASCCKDCYPRGVGQLPREKLRDLLLASANLYPTDPTVRERVIGSRYFLRILVRDFDADLCGWLLDEITRGLACICGARSWECHCRDGISKIAGHLLDRYFDIAEVHRDPGKDLGLVETASLPSLGRCQG